VPITKETVYPEQIWKFSTKLTQDNAEETIEAAINSGRTIFVRFVEAHNQQCGLIQAPGWNGAMKLFKEQAWALSGSGTDEEKEERWRSKASVLFGEVSIATDPISTIGGTVITNKEAGVGANGWPAIWYYNKRTGLAGRPYSEGNGPAKGKALRERLKMKKNMIMYVLQAAEITLCTVLSGKGCTGKERAYIEMHKDKPADELKSEQVRLREEAMKPDAMKFIKVGSKWVPRSSAIGLLSQLIKGAKSEDGRGKSEGTAEITTGGGVENKAGADTKSEL
jgi:hypothetical protein